MHNPFTQQIIHLHRIKIFVTIVNSQILDFSLKLILDHPIKIFENLTHYRFFFHEENPNDSSVIVNKGNGPSSAGNVINPRWSPDIIVDH